MIAVSEKLVQWMSCNFTGKHILLKELWRLPGFLCSIVSTKNKSFIEYYSLESMCADSN